MQPLNLEKEFHPWTAEFANGDKLSMLSTGTEIPFKAVLDREDSLIRFFIHLDHDQLCGVNLANGYFTFDGHSWFPPPEHVAAHNGEKYRIIYFRRMQMDMQVFGTTTPKARAKLYVLGWQINVDGENHQRIIEIYPNGFYDWKKKQ